MMSVTLRISLIVVSVITCIWILRRIRKAQVKIEDSVFWFLFSTVLVLMGIFPQVMTEGAKIMGFQSPTNFVFLGIIFIMLVKLFRMSIKISQLESKLQGLTQRYALDQVKSGKEKSSFELDK